MPWQSAASAGHSAQSASPSSARRRFLFFWLSVTALVSSGSLVWLYTRAADKVQPLAQSNRLRLAKLTESLRTLGHSDPLAYRRAVHLATTPPHQLEHSRTLTFDHIYVLSLPARQDRRNDMAKLADALGIDLTFVDAADKREPFLQWIAERVRESRDLRARVMAEARGVPPSKIGGMSIGSDWVTPFPGPLNSSSLDRFPPYPRADRKLGYQGDNWVTHLEALHSAGERHTSLRPFTTSRQPKKQKQKKPPHGTSNRNAPLNVTELLWDPLERQHVRQVHEGIISTYWGQTRSIKRMLENGDRTALILEDDVDIEWDLERLWNAVERRLPVKDGSDGGGKREAEWDVAYLGHCWGGEYQQPQYLNPLLHRSTGPMCLHAYALSAKGARRMLDTMLDPWSAYSTAVDLVVPSLLHIQTALDALAKKEAATSERKEAKASSRLINSFSVVPPLVVQRKDGPSDLQSGTGSKWRGLLRDSTVERIKRDEGSWTDEWEDRYDEAEPDPATVVRCGVV